MLLSLPDTPPACGEPLFHATLKSSVGDFCVEEILGFEPNEGGEHLYLLLEKRNMNTNELAELLETAYSVSSKEVGYAGMKDRHAITCQWFSITTAEDENVLAEALASAGLAPVQQVAQSDSIESKQVLIKRACRHAKKLRRGAHQANRFSITLRDVEWQGAIEQQDGEQWLEKRIQLIRERGFPNYLGPQRFGHGGQNFRRAQQWFGNPKKRTSRQQRSLWLSAARSALFNSVCAARVKNDNWHELLGGEPVVLDGSKSFFEADNSSPDELRRRLDAFDIHPSAPWWGRGRNPTKAECATFEEPLLANYHTVCLALEKAGLKQERRALRANAVDLSHEWLDESTLKIDFLLSPGVFATTLLNELCLCVEPERGRAV